MCILGLIIMVLITGLIMINSPEGYEDETGFHYGIKGCENKSSGVEK